MTLSSRDLRRNFRKFSIISPEIHANCQAAVLIDWKGGVSVSFYRKNAANVPRKYAI